MFLEIPGDAADHLYREGSAKASFWETIFGSSLRAKRRTRVSARPDGTRVFDVPLLDVEHGILSRAREWLGSDASRASGKQAAAPLSLEGVRVRLIGLQPPGRAVASFSLRFEPSGPEASVTPQAAEAFRSWFEAEGSRLARDILIPFGFTPHHSTLT